MSDRHYVDRINLLLINVNQSLYVINHSHKAIQTASTSIGAPFFFFLLKMQCQYKNTLHLIKVKRKKGMGATMCIRDDLVTPACWHANVPIPPGMLMHL